MSNSRSFNAGSEIGSESGQSRDMRFTAEKEQGKSGEIQFSSFGTMKEQKRNLKLDFDMAEKVEELKVRLGNDGNAESKERIVQENEAIVGGNEAIEFDGADNLCQTPEPIKSEIELFQPPESLKISKCPSYMMGILPERPMDIENIQGHFVEKQSLHYQNNGKEKMLIESESENGDLMRDNEDLNMDRLQNDSGKLNQWANREQVNSFGQRIFFSEMFKKEKIDYDFDMRRINREAKGNENVNQSNPYEEYFQQNDK